MASDYRKKPMVSFTEQRSDVDSMLLDGTASPAYSEKIPNPHEYVDKQLVINDEELAPPSPLPPTDLEDTPASSSLRNGKHLKFHHASFPWRNVNITSISGTPAYYAEISEATPKKPDILLRSPDRNGAGVGRSYFRLTRSMRAGIGEDELSAGWVEFKSSSLISKGSFDFVFEGRNYCLQRTRSSENGVEGLHKISLANFKVVDIESRELVAVYASETFHPAWMKGMLTLREGVSRELELVIALGVVGWREKMRRRAAYSGHGGGGGA